MKKTFIISMLFLLTSAALNAQFYKSFLPSPAFTDSLSIIVGDFKYNFQQIQGDSLLPANDMDIFTSKVSLPGALNCVIYRFHSFMDTTASWQALMYRGDSYKEAVKAYKNTFRLVKKSHLRWLNRMGMEFKGQMEEPSETVGFAVSTLMPDSPDPYYTKFTIEIELVNAYDGWEVHLNLQNKRDDMEGKTGYPN